jgi:hypothetical protein
MSDTAQLLWYILIIGVIGVGALLVGVLAARFVKKRVQTTTPAEAFTIQDLREMHQRGEITTPEYEVMRATIIARATAPPPPGPGQPEPASHERGQRQPDAGSDVGDSENPPPTEDPKDQ